MAVTFNKESGIEYDVGFGETEGVLIAGSPESLESSDIRSAYLEQIEDWLDSSLLDGQAIDIAILESMRLDLEASSTINSDVVKDIVELMIEWSRNVEFSEATQVEKIKQLLLECFCALILPEPNREVGDSKITANLLQVVSDEDLFELGVKSAGSPYLEHSVEGAAIKEILRRSDNGAHLTEIMTALRSETSNVRLIHALDIIEKVMSAVYYDGGVVYFDNNDIGEELREIAKSQQSALISLLVEQALLRASEAAAFENGYTSVGTESLDEQGMFERRQLAQGVLMAEANNLPLNQLNQHQAYIGVATNALAIVDSNNLGIQGLYVTQDPLIGTNQELDRSDVFWGSMKARHPTLYKEQALSIESAPDMRYVVNLGQDTTINPMNIDLEGSSDLIRTLHEPSVRMVIEGDLGLSLNELSLASQIHLLRFMLSADTDRYYRLTNVVSLIGSAKVLFLESFLAMEVGDEFGDILIEVAESVNPEVLEILLSRISSIRVSVASIANRMNVGESGLDYARGINLASVKRITEMLSIVPALANGQSVSAYTPYMNGGQHVVFSQAEYPIAVLGLLDKGLQRIESDLETRPLGNSLDLSDESLTHINFSDSSTKIALRPKASEVGEARCGLRTVLEMSDLVEAGFASPEDEVLSSQARSFDIRLDLEEATGLLSWDLGTIEVKSDQKVRFVNAIVGLTITAGAQELARRRNMPIEQANNHVREAFSEALADPKKVEAYFEDIRYSFAPIPL